MSNKRGSDLPEPAWWARCRAMKAAGYTNREVAAALNKSDSSVDGVLNREKRLAHRRERYARDKLKLPPRDRSDRDHMRTKARAEARSRWRNEQYKRPLETYYRELECL